MIMLVRFIAGFVESGTVFRGERKVLLTLDYVESNTMFVRVWSRLR